MFFLIHCGLVTPYGDGDLVNVGSDNALIHDGNKLSLMPMLIINSATNFAESAEVINSCYKFANSLAKLLPLLSGANELIYILTLLQLPRPILMTISV